MNQSNLDNQIESVVSALAPGRAREDFRTLMGSIIDQVTSISPAGNWLQPGGVKSNSSAAPTGVSLSVSAANGVYTITVLNSNKNSANTSLFYEISFSATKGFTSGVTTLPPSAATSLTLSLPGTSYFFRVRSSADFVNWSPYALASTSSISSGLVSSAATSEAGAFNQTNYMIVDSVAVGASANVRVYGSAGPLKSGTLVKGSAQRLAPSATIVNVTPASSHFVGFDGSQYVLKPTLATVLEDGLTPIGKVSVVGTGTPTLPTVVPVIGSGGAIIAYNVPPGGGGAGATSDYIFTITDPGGPGTGATTGTQTFNAGVLVSVGPGNAGQNYDSHTTVSASGGTSSGSPGGGTAVGGNGGRLSAV